MTELDADRIEELRAEGLTVMEIAEEVGSDYETVRLFCHEQDIIEPRNISDRWNHKDIEYFKSLWNGRATREKIAEIMDVSVPTVKRMAKRLGLPGKYSDEHPVRKRLIEQSIEYYKEGMSCEEVAERLFINDETVRKYINKYAPEIMRTCGGISQRKHDRQNIVLKEFYLAGVPYDEISKRIDLGSHGILKRRKEMGLKRKGNPEYEIWKELVPDSSFRQQDIIDIFLTCKATWKDFDQYTYRIKYYSQVLDNWRWYHNDWIEFQEIRPKLIKLIKSRRNRLGNHYVPEARIKRKKRRKFGKTKLNKSMKLKLGVEPGDRRQIPVGFVGGEESGL